MTWRLSEGVSYHRFVLPTELFRARYDQAGTRRILLLYRPTLKWQSSMQLSCDHGFQPVTQRDR
jgi:hypothetical protein